MKNLIILRGLPGSGKTTLGALLTELACRAPGGAALHVEADDFFYDGDGNYIFDPSLLGEAHTDCQVRVVEGMEAEVPLIIVSNTSSQNWEMRRYVGFAQRFGYAITVVTVEPGVTVQELAERNVHGCPLEQIEKMNNRWEGFSFRSTGGG